MLTGVRDLVARGYVIPGGANQGGGRAPAFRVARCQTGTQVGHFAGLIAMAFGIGTVTFGIDRIPLHRISIQFEWAEPFGEL